MCDIVGRATRQECVDISTRGTINVDKFKDIESLFPRPAGYDGECNGTPYGDEIPEKLTDDHVTEAYLLPWEKYGHLKDADADFKDAVWGIQDGRRDIRQQKDIPMLDGKGKK